MQFAGTSPVFVDVGSFERLRRSEPWPGYRQFCELFLNPLLVQALRDVPFQPLLRGSVHGIPPVVAADLLRGSGHLTKGVFTHVKLHARAERRYADADLERDLKAELEARRLRSGRRRRPAEEPGEGRPRADVGPPGVDVVGLLRPQPLRRGRPRGQGALRRRRRRSRAPSVLDLGANDGHFSRLALRAGAGSVVAVDSDDLVVDRLYRDLRAEGEQRILPLVLDLSDPSPALGWRSRERPAFVDRVRPDLVLCLAVVHHLALTNTVPLDEIVAFLADFGAPLVVEFPHDDDPMAARLLARKRAGVFDAYHRDNWERAWRPASTCTPPRRSRRHAHAVPSRATLMAHGRVRSIINLDERRQRVRPYLDRPPVWAGHTGGLLAEPVVANVHQC